MRSLPSFLPSPLRDRLARPGPVPVVTRLRQAAAVVLLVVAAVLAAGPPASSSAPTRPMLVAARDIATGSVLAGHDLHVTQVPASVLPDGHLTAERAALGRILVGAARRGEPITDARLVRQTRQSLDAGQSAVAVRLADSGVADLLRPGTSVDVVTADRGSDGRQILATGATVLTVLAAEPGNQGVSGGRLVLLELPRAGATRVASASLTRPVTVTLR